MTAHTPDGAPADQIQFETARVKVMREAVTGYDLVTFPHPKGAIIVPRRNTRGITEFGFVTQFRHTLGAETLEFPRGRVEDHETHAEGATREMLEETGLAVDPSSGVDLGAVWPDTGILRTDVHAFMYTVPAGIPATAEAGIATRWLSGGEIVGAIAYNKIVCGMTLAAWAKVTARGYHRLP